MKLIKFKYDNLRYSKREDDPLIIVNKEPKSKGFMVCMDEKEFLTPIKKVEVRYA